MQADSVSIEVEEAEALQGLLLTPEDAWCVCVLAHGAGAGMSHAFMEDAAQALAVRGVATLRFNFPFMARAGGFSRKDTPETAARCVRAAARHAREACTGLPLFAGGKSYGARMTSMADAAQAIDDVRGLVLMGFPLHLAKKPSVARAEHLSRVRQPMLFLQGDRDALADLTLMHGVCSGLPNAHLHVVEGADHGFGVLVRSGRKPEQVMTELADVSAEWMRALC